MQPDQDVYPMPLFPRLAVSDVSESTGWYEALGFDVVYSMPAMAHVRYRKYADVMLAADATLPFGASDDTGSPPPDRRGAGVSLFVTVESEPVDDVAGRARSSGIDVGDGPVETPWNTRELRLADPDGYEVVFSEGPVDEAASFDEVFGSTEPGE